MLITTCFQISYSQSESSQVLKLSDIADSEVKRTKGICHAWVTGRHFSLSMSVEDFRFLKLHSKSNLRAEISECNVMVQRSDAKVHTALNSYSLGNPVTCALCLRMCKFPGTELLIIHGRKKFMTQERAGSSFYCFIFEAKKFTAAILVRPLCCETSVSLNYP